MNPVLADFVKALLMPLLVGKALILFFGLQYAEYPGEGYGYGLILSIAFTAGNLVRFVWKYRNIEDP